MSEAVYDTTEGEFVDFATLDEWATIGKSKDARIEKLEAELAEYKHVASAIDTQWAESQDEIADLKANLANAVEALGTALSEMVDYADTHPAWSEIWEAREAARTTLAELTSSEAANGEAKGGKDE